VHVDHLNAPRLIANDTPQVVWRWEQQEPFGLNAPDENPSALGVFEQPLRFLGQYADKETNLFYNYFRDYDPSVGRYAQSDPIGMRGGLNTYAYVGGNPLRYVDAFGLTLQDIEHMLELVYITQADLNVPGTVSTYEGGVPGGGITFPIPGRPVAISDVYLGPLTNEQLVNLFEVLTHESIHKTRPFSDLVVRPFKHQDIYDDARKRTRDARPFIENYFKPKTQCTP
jgi:RHS repeat-associated protein